MLNAFNGGYRQKYFSYGSDKTKLDESSRHSNDVNLHLKTQGYEDGEEVRVELETSRGSIITSSTIHNNQAIIMNILKEYEG